MGPKSASTTSPGKRGRPTKTGSASSTKVSVEVPAPKHAVARESSSCCLESVLNFAILAGSSLLLSTALFSLSVPITKGDLAWTSKRLDSWRDVTALLAWRIIELAVPWFSGYDAWDTLCFIGLIHLPAYSLLLNFYNIRPTTIITVATITVLSCTIPFSYFRPLGPAHSGSPAASRAILADRLTTAYTTVASTLVYTILIYLSFVTWLPTHLVTYFTGLPDISAAHAGPKGFVSLFLSLLPAGYGARDLLFVASASQPPEQKAELKTTRRQLRSSDSRKDEEEQGEESCIASLYKKAWLGLSPSLRTLISRSVVLAIMTLANTFVQLAGTISGVEPKGALGWGSIWSIATLSNAVLYGWIQEASGL
ncbi:hypothetical protein MGYG_01140 [Nannizzia gypsea CBS 118893]|uniref:Uncharacterized protein n=1 Tax=Arthroderma gypseum (strain ATCC MYA-4604 / CBS 118893) TaxID=535722 RepID=E5QYX9_ARTGP|nr:hypothetical protein MGYG_01140 [Nannizzia gypsea CBS 118893]EFQ98102.1 hypothetical protein MGYG_01140 [Nannizzia gypsea CBS 118893]